MGVAIGSRLDLKARSFSLHKELIVFEKLKANYPYIEYRKLNSRIAERINLLKVTSVTKSAKNSVLRSVFVYTKYIFFWL